LNGIEALIVYPVFSSGTILIVTFVSLIAFKERLNRRQLLGLLLILLSIVLLNL
jgi:multidrug transporter EmrE-like cation transporter